MLPLGRILKKFKGTRLSLTTYGLELTYPNRFYQAVFVNEINNLDNIIAISNATKKEVIDKEVNKRKVKVIPCGINPY